MIYDHALHSIRIFTMFHAFNVCLNVENCMLVGLDWVQPMMQLFLAHHMFMHFSCIHTLSFLYIFSVCDVSLFLPLSLSLSDRLRMAPKRKSTPAQNPLGSESSTDLPTPPLHVRFHDGKAQ